MTLDFKKTFDNAKRNVTKASIARSVTRTRQHVVNYYNGSVGMPKAVEEAVIKVFEDNGDEVYYLDR